MESALEDLLDEIRRRAPGRLVESLTDRISVLFQAHSAPIVDTTLSRLGLTKHEARIVRFLQSKQGKCVSKGAIMDATYFDRIDQPEMKILDVLLCRIREKLEQVTAPYWIETVGGEGLIFHDGPIPANIQKRNDGVAIYRELATDPIAVRERAKNAERRSRERGENQVAA